jgi:peroxiredoxin
MKCSAQLRFFTHHSVPITFLLAALTFLTGTPRLIPAVVPLVPLDWGAYQAFAREASAMKSFVPIRARPAHLSEAARYGYDFVVAHQNRGWVLDRSAAGSWVLYLDWKGNGDLSAARAQPFQCTKDTCALEVIANDGKMSYPIRFRLVKSGSAMGVAIDDRAERDGAIVIGDRSVPFVLFGVNGKYDDPTQQSLEIKSPGGPRRYSTSQPYLNLFGASYAFDIDPQGMRLTLKRAGRQGSDRPSLLPGSEAPDFLARDTAGSVQDLSKYRGRLLLLDFSANWCEPCHRDAPAIVSFYKRTARKNFAILSVTNDDVATARAFEKAYGMTWPAVHDRWLGSMHQAYRVYGLPTYFLIARDGTILETWSGGDEVEQRLGKYLH